MLGIAVSDADQHEHSLADFADGFRVDLYLRTEDSLQNDSHLTLLFLNRL